MNISYLCIYLHLQFFINILQFSAHIHFIFVKLAEMDRDHAYFRRQPIGLSPSLSFLSLKSMNMPLSEDF